MNAEDVLNALGEKASLEAVRLRWEKSEECFPDEVPSFLNAAEFIESRTYCGFDDSVDDPLRRTAERVISDPHLLHLAWHCYRFIYYREEEGLSMQGWPTLEKSLGKELCGCFHLLVALAMVPKLKEVHAAWEVEEEVTHDTASQIRLFSENYRPTHEGRYGLVMGQLDWIRHYVDESRYFRIGRMEYWLKPWRGGAEAYRRNGDGYTLALAPDGSRFTRDGFKQTDPSEETLHTGWKATLETTDTEVSGYPVSPLGAAENRKVTLPLSEWTHVLTTGTPVLEMHIPSGGGMTPDAYTSSMRGAVEFFRRRFPDEHPVAIVCNSWLFNTQLEEILPPTANLVRYQKELYLYPVPSSGNDGLWFIFLQDPFDPKTAPRDTSLRRAVLDFLDKGNTWRGGGMFFLIEDMEHFGTQYYREQYRKMGTADV